MNLRLVLVLASLAVVTALPSGALGQSPVRVAMRPAIISDSDTIRLADVAELTGGNPTDRARMAQLDFDVTLPGTLPRNEAVTRLLLAGFDASEFQFAGPESTHVIAGQPGSTSAFLIDAIRSHVAHHAEVDPDQVAVQIPNPPEIPAGVLTGQLELKPLEHLDRIVGRRLIRLGVFLDGTLRDEIRVNAETTIARDVLVSTRPIERNEILDAENTAVRTRQLDSLKPGSWLDPSARGSAVARRIIAHAVLKQGDLARADSTSDDPLLIKSRDAVTAVARKGSLKITMSGMEAMRSGRLGDVIPVRNPATGVTIMARIVDGGTVEVPFQ